MSGFLSSTTALTVYHIDTTATVTFDKLKQYVFRSIDDIPEPRGWGWTNIDDMFDTEWRISPPEKGNFLCFALRTDIRKVAPGVLKKHLSEALRTEEAKAQAEGIKVTRFRKKELKDQYTAKLLSQSEPVPSAVDVALDISTGLLYVGTTSASALETFEGYFETSFGVKPQGMTPGDDETSISHLLRTIYEHGLHVSHDGFEYDLGEAGQASLLHPESGAVVTAKDEPDTVFKALEAGLYFTRLKMRIERDEELTWELAMNSAGQFLSLKTPTVNKDSDEDPDAVLLEKLYLTGQAVNVLLAAGRSQA